VGTLDIDYAALTGCDIALVPVGGTFTIDAQEAKQLREKLQPKIFIPMHFKTEGVDFPIAPVEDFLSGREEVLWEGGSEVEVTASGLPEGVMVLNPANLP